MNDKTTVPTQKIFDGMNSVTVSVCCSGKVLRKDTFLAEAFRNMVLNPVLTEAVLICRDCGRVLHRIK